VHRARPPVPGCGRIETTSLGLRSRPITHRISFLNVKRYPAGEQPQQGTRKFQRKEFARNTRFSAVHRVCAGSVSAPRAETPASGAGRPNTRLLAVIKPRASAGCQGHFRSTRRSGQIVVEDNRPPAAHPDPERNTPPTRTRRNPRTLVVGSGSFRCPETSQGGAGGVQPQDIQDGCLKTSRTAAQCGNG
jgi:hypothetical protein